MKFTTVSTICLNNESKLKTSLPHGNDVFCRKLSSAESKMKFYLKKYCKKNKNLRQNALQNCFYIKGNTRKLIYVFDLNSLFNGQKRSKISRYRYLNL